MSLLRFALALGATVLSLVFITRNLYPVIANAPNVSARLLVVIIIVLHLIMSLTVYWGFMAGGSGALHSGNPDLGGDDSSGGSSGSGSAGGGDMDNPAGDGHGLSRLLF